ncbi:odorant receptor 33a-like isoform X1 [Temnothorax americanus]|uniref:odorant receptor 33a-like isoform X1 n=1 Tax=Temnothorax americanus TaxID=1964332 RepID=UPI00406974CE
MRILNLPFILLTICGCWRPNSWSSLYKRVAYYVYTSIIVFIINTFILSLLVEMTLIMDNTDEFCDTFFLLIDLLNTFFKAFILLINRKNIIMLIDILTKKPCEPSTSTEINIVSKFDKSIENTTWYYVYLEVIACLWMVLSLLFNNFRNRILPYRAWYPFDYSSTFMFSLMFTYQLIGIAAADIINVACDTLIWGLLVHICCQIEILTHRLRRIISHSNVLRDCVHHHYDIYRFAFIVNKRFRLTIAMQFITTTSVVCFCFYQLSIATTKARHIEIISYVSCTLIEIFCYSWYGNELKTKLSKHFNTYEGEGPVYLHYQLPIALFAYNILSTASFANRECRQTELSLLYESQQMSDNIYEMEWLTLDKNKIKSLMIIMRRTIVPIQITCAYIVPMNLNTFMGILKTSYSFYNLLIQNM